MLKVDDLKAQLQKGFEDIIPAAIEQCKLNENSIQTALIREQTHEFAETFKELVSEPLAEVIANAIDYYIKNASITGRIITNGSPTTHTAKITSLPTPSVNGVVPNTLGIS